MMKRVVCYHSSAQDYHRLEVDELLFQVKSLSRVGQLDPNELIASCRARKILDWDVLMTETQFGSCCELVSTLIEHCDAVRVADLGAANFMREKFPHVPLQLNLEAKGRNLSELLFWQQFHPFERLVLSNEISFERLSEYCQKISIPLEILVLGSIRLAYTPRKLFGDQEKRVEIDSLESSHNNYPILQNDLGTQMFHVKDLTLLDHLDEIEKLGVEAVRIDPPQGMDIDQILMGSKDLNYPRAVTRGFFKSNRSDILFEKLTNKNTIRRDRNYLGDIVEVNRGKYLALNLRNPERPLKNGEKIYLRTPDGKDKYATIHFLKSCALEDLDQASEERIVLVNHVKGISVRTACYFCDDE